MGPKRWARELRRQTHVGIRRRDEARARALTPGRRKTTASQVVLGQTLLLADAEFRNNAFVALGVVFLEVVKQATPLAHQHQKAAPGRVVLFVRLEVLRQLANALTQQRDLNFRTAGIAGMGAVLADDGLLLLSS
jgi:hypothetical protein